MRHLSIAARFPRPILALDLTDHGLLPLQSGACEPDLADCAGLVARAADGLAVAAISCRQGNPAGVAAGDLDFAGIQERVEAVRTADHYHITNRHQIDGAPGAPPSSGPITHAACRRATGRE